MTSITAHGDGAAGVEPGFRVHDLGSLVLEVGGTHAAIRGAKPMRILTTLVIDANRRVSVDALVDAVWGEQATSSSVGTLESHIWRLRRAMEPNRARGEEPTYLVNDSGGYRLIINPEQADSLRFAQLAEQGDSLLASGDHERARQRYESALSLWRGRPFEAVADEEWAAAAIAPLEELYGQVSERYVEALLRTGERARAIGELEEMTGRLPFRERLWGQLMTGLYQEGRIEESLATFGRAREVLLDTLGLEPGADLRELQQRILRQDPALDPPSRPAPPPPRERVEPVAVDLPSRLTPLVGREVELAQLARLVERGPLVTLVGTAGCGKTRLAIDLARAAAASAPDGVWFVDLAAVDDPDAVPDVVMTTLGIAAPPVGGATAALRSYVHDHRILLLIDNCEHLLTAVYRLFDTLLDIDSQCRILATSREPTGFDGEVLWTLAPLATRGTNRHSPSDIPPDDQPSAAARLFLSRAERVDPRFTPSPDSLAQIEAICTAVDGIPLAVELAAGRLRSASLTEIGHQVDTELATLSGVGAGRAEHHRTVEKSIDWSTRLLDRDERLVHARLSVLPGFFTVEAAAAIAGAPPLSPGRIADLLDRLVHRSLLAAVPGERRGQATRFRQLATVRAHARRLLTSGEDHGAGEEEVLLDRRDHWVSSLATVASRTDRLELRRRYAQVDDNADVVRAVLQHRLVDRPALVGARVAGWLHGYWWYRGQLLEAVRWLSLAAELLATRGPEPDANFGSIETAWVELGLAKMLAHRGRLDLAQQHLHRGLELGDSVAPQERAAYGLDLAILAGNVWSAGDPDLARSLVDRTAALVDPDGDADGNVVLEVLAEASRTLVDCVVIEPHVTLNRAGEVYTRAREVDLDVGAWMAARAGSYAALTARDAQAGLAWSGRAIQLHRREGAELGGVFVEMRANFLTLAGEYRAATVLYSSARTQRHREGLMWRSLPESAELRDRARAALDSADHEAAWREGESLTFARIADALPDLD